MNRNQLIAVVSTSSVTTFGLGIAAGYFVAKKRLTQAFDARIQKEIEYTKEFYKRLNKREEFETPEKAAQVLLPTADTIVAPDDNEFSAAAIAADAVKSYQGRPGVSKEELGEVESVNIEGIIQKNVFTKVNVKMADLDWDVEVRNRTEEAPYVLKQMEFMDGELDYQQVTLTYYAGDGVLVDERDDVIEEPDELVGLYNLKRFGHWSGDDRVVYVRNCVKELDIEILLHDGKYSEIVAGQTG